MTSLVSTVDHLLLCDPETSRSTANIALPGAEDTARERLGRLFLVTDISPAHPGNQEIIRLLQETVEHTYYGIADRGVETTFEAAIAEANARLQEVLREERHAWLPGFSAFIGALKDNFFVFAHVGHMQAFLMRGTRVVELTQTSGTPPTPNPLKIFSSVVSGQLDVGDALLISSSSLLDYFSQEKLRRTILGSSPSDAVHYLDQLLRDNPTNTCFAAVIIQCHETTAPIPAPGQYAVAPVSLTPPSEGSMDRLIRREQATSELLTPSLWQSAVVVAKHGWTTVEDAIRIRVLRKPARRRTVSWKDRKSPQPRSLILTAGQSVLRIALRIIVAIFRLFIAGIASVLRLTRRPRRTISPPPAAWTSRIRTLPRRQQIVLGTIAALVLILVPTVLIQARQRGRVATGTDRATLEQQIADKTVTVKTMTSYGDENGAKTVLAEIDTAIAQLPSRSKNDKKRIEEIQSQLSEARALIAHVVKPTFTRQVDISTIRSIPSAGIVKRGAQIFAVTVAGDVIDVSETDQPKLSGTPGPDITVTDVLADTAGLLLVTADGILQFTPGNGRYTNLPVALPEERGGFSTFQQRLYVVDVSAGQIYRYPRGSTNFGTSVSWLKQTGLSLGSVVDLVVDGSVFLLRENGAVDELISGLKTDFALETIDPVLTTATQMWTDPDSESLYILSPASERLVVFDKQGRLRAQFVDPLFKDVLGFAIDEKADAAYALTNSTVEKFELGLKE